MMKDPTFVFPHLWPSCLNCSEKTLQYFFVHMLVDCLTLWQELEVNNIPCIKESNQHDLDFRPQFSCCICPWGMWTFPLQTLSFGFRVTF